jgi:hypothetical protein
MMKIDSEGRVRLFDPAENKCLSATIAKRISQALSQLLRSPGNMSRIDLRESPA